MEMYNRNTNNDKNEVAEKRGSLSMNVLRLLMKNLEVRRINWNHLREMQV